MMKNKHVKQMMVTNEFNRQFGDYLNRFKLLRWKWINGSFVFYVSDLIGCSDVDIEASPFYGQTISLTADQLKGK